MSIERDLETAFAKHANDVTPEQGAWESVRTGVRRSHRVRLAISSLAAVAAVAAVAVVVPALSQHRAAGRGPIGAPSRPETTPSPGVTAPPAREGQVFYRDDDAHWMMPFDSSWKASHFEAVTSFVPPGLPSPESGGDTATITVQVLDGSYDSQPGGRSNRQATKLAARQALVEESTDAGRRTTYLVDWTLAGCTPPDPCPAPSNDSTLEVSIAASNDDLWSRYGLLATSWVRNGLRIARPIEKTETSIQTRFGRVDAGLRYDDRTATLVRFLDRRVEQDAATSYLSEGAKKEFDDPNGSLGLNGPRRFASSGTVFNWYEVSGRVDPDANAAEFTVRLTWRDAATDRPGFETETLTMSADASGPILVLSATQDGSQCTNCPFSGPPGLQPYPSHQ